jgi:CYTH domain-containing protein
MARQLGASPSHTGVGKEVSHDPRYYNVCLGKNPYKNWGAETLAK